MQLCHRFIVQKVEVMDVEVMWNECNKTSDDAVSREHFKQEDIKK